MNIRHRRNKTYNRYYGLRSDSWRELLIVLVLVAIACSIAMQARAEGLPAGAYISPVPFSIGALDENGLPTLTIAQQADWQSFITAAREIARIYDMPLKVIVAQAALESGRGTSQFAILRHNYFGMGAYDADPNQAFRYSSLQEGIIEYCRLIKHRYPEAYAERANPDRMIELIHASGYASDPAYVTKIKALPEWSAL